MHPDLVPNTMVLHKPIQAYTYLIEFRGNGNPLRRRMPASPPLLNLSVTLRSGNAWGLVTFCKNLCSRSISNDEFIPKGSDSDTQLARLALLAGGDSAVMA